MPTDPPIFILGITPRSGTNYLSDLLCLHSDCRAPAPYLEDHLLHHAHHLAAYARDVQDAWQPRWGVEAAGEARLLQCLGDGLSAFLSAGINGHRLVTKTPRIWNLAQFFRLFPEACLLVLIRDGRAVAESMVRSFGVSYDWSIHQWAEAAREVLKFERDLEGAGGNCRIVRYESLFDNLTDELESIMAFTGLDPAVYDFDAAVDLPVRGSSQSVASGRVSWTPVPRSPDFVPTLRWRHWERARHERFNWIAGDELLKLGYEPSRYTGHRLACTLRNIVMDVVWFVRGTLHATHRGAVLAWRKLRKRPAVRGLQITEAGHGPS